MELQRVTKGYRGYRGLQRVTGCERLKAVTLISGYRGVSMGYGDYKGLQRITGG